MPGDEIHYPHLPEQSSSAEVSEMYTGPAWHYPLLLLLLLLFFLLHLLTSFSSKILHFFQKLKFLTVYVREVKDRLLSANTECCVEHSGFVLGLTSASRRFAVTEVEPKQQSTQARVRTWGSILLPAPTPIPLQTPAF